jgi:hypothetical protein
MDINNRQYIDGHRHRSDHSLSQPHILHPTNLKIEIRNTCGIVTYQIWVHHETKERERRKERQEKKVRRRKGRRKAVSELSPDAVQFPFFIPIPIPTPFRSYWFSSAMKATIKNDDSHRQQ